MDHGHFYLGSLLCPQNRESCPNFTDPVLPGLRLLLDYFVVLRHHFRCVSS